MTGFYLSLCQWHSLRGLFERLEGWLDELGRDVIPQVFILDWNMDKKKSIVHVLIKCLPSLSKILIIMMKETNPSLFIYFLFISGV